MKLDLPPNKNPRLNMHMRAEVMAMLVELSESYHLPQSAIVTTAIVELYNARLGPQRKKRGNGHT